MRILGIDPGINGGVAIYDGGLCWGAMDIPTDGEKAKRRVTAHELRDWINDGEPVHAFIERAQAMPDQGASSGFIYGRAVGAIEAVVACCAVPLTIIESRAWKQFHGLLGQKNKEASRQRALQLVPGASALFKLKKDHGKAEALLIAIYGQWLLGARKNAESVPARVHQSSEGRGA